MSILSGKLRTKLLANRRATSGDGGRKRRMLSLFLFGIFIIGILNYIAPDIATTTHCVLASAILVVGIIPTFVYFYRMEANIPYLPLWGLIYAIYYGLPVFVLDDFSIREWYLTQETVTTSLWFALIGAILLLGAFYWLPAYIGKILPRVSIELEPSRAKIAAVLLSLIGVATIFIGSLSDQSSFASIYGFISQWNLLGAAILYLFFLKGQLHILLRLYLWLALLPVIFLKDLGTGLMANPLRDLLLLFFIYWAVRRIVPLKTIILCIVILIPFFGMKNEFRQRAWFGEESSAGPIEKGVSFINLVNEGAAEDPRKSLETSVDDTSRRAANLMILAVVVQTTPGDVPYWGGETYATLLTTLIPRALWPGKPQKTLGQDFGHRYRFLDDHDTGTSCNLPQLVEMYANFGWLGILIGMPLLGIMYRLVYEVLNHSKAGTGGMIIAALIFIGLANIESDFSLVFGGLIQATVSYVILLRFAGRPIRQIRVTNGHSLRPRIVLR